MEHQKTSNLLNEASHYKFVSRKRNIVNDQSNANYDAGIEVNNTEILKFNLCDYNDSYILVGGDNMTSAHSIPTQLAFKNCASFIKCITKKLMEQP